ncbi:ATP-binding protein [Geobacter sp.]|uniref:sensor histidine kinase n=1 Tax=Geobacter sp. TaxID=46610 RepID=UPI00262DFDD7|nr:ATP-binding protein [Geobacter sp.]
MEAIKFSPEHDELSPEGETGRARLLETILTVSPDLHFVLDEELRFICVSRSGLELFGRSEEELIGRHWRETGLPAEVMEGHEREVRSVLNTAAVLRGQTWYPASAGARVFDYVISAVTDRQGKATAAVVSWRDVTGQKLALAELERSNTEHMAALAPALQLEKMAAIGQLAAGVAHEINNPVAFIASNLTTLDKYLERLTAFVAAQSERLAQLGCQARNELEEMRRSLRIDYILGDCRHLVAESQEGVERVRGIVRDLKSFSRSDGADPERIDLNGCLESTINIAWNELKYKATLKREYGELPPVVCHPQQLGQVFLNLLVNAAHAIESHGEITVTTRAQDGSVFVSVADTGCGIPPDKLQRIFEPFYTTKEAGKGTGLGLSISSDIVKKHGGEIAVESEQGKGTVFTVRLPTDPSGEAEAP